MKKPEKPALPKNHLPVAMGKAGVLLVNLGTPDATDYWSMRRYLKEFLSDRRVIDLNPVLWHFLLNTVILTKRPFSSGHAYKSIWNTDADESPLLTITKRQHAWLSGRLAGKAEVAWAMRYGNPSIARGLDDLRARGCDKILVFALYPQYSAATTATVHDKAFEHLSRLNWQPAIRTISGYHDHPAYIGALAQQVANALKKTPAPDLVVTSFHGLPKRYWLEGGDPYHCLCAKTSRLLREKLGWPEDKWLLAFQSRFGREEWLQPYIDEELVRRIRAGKARRIAVLAPGFVADCVETLEELDIRLRQDAMNAGAESFTYIPCLNDSNSGMEALLTIIQTELSGWIE